MIDAFRQFQEVVAQSVCRRRITSHINGCSEHVGDALEVRVLAEI
jgi:hypothetical protein